MISPAQLSEFYRQACEIELQAFKPGNVSVYADGHGMTVADFRCSAEASAEPLCRLDYSLGEKIFYAVKATRDAVGCNTNLGIILLSAPLIQAMGRISSGLTLRQALGQVLSATTIADADWVFRAIALASPGGLGASEQQDVHGQAATTLTQAMALAAAKDRIACQYTTGYRDIFDFSVVVYYNALSRWGDHDWAAVAVYAEFLRRFPDSHIERKYGSQYSEMVADKMMSVCEALSDAIRPDSIMPLLYCIDYDFKSKNVNPGTTADITVATVFAVFLEDFIRSSNKFVKTNK
ncbi:MAG: triphosphoribosyl-dephospho-CoA synthase [Methylovulum sp.]|nr:triphosphoribosyl-dephospho-CoA synthase [Methylovulum sp.]